MADIAYRLASALGCLLESMDAPFDGSQTQLDVDSAKAALAAYDAYIESTPRGEVKSNRAWREEVQLLRAERDRLMGAIDRLALIPADDFYKPGDYASGLVADAWREAKGTAHLAPAVPGYERK